MPHEINDVVDACRFFSSRITRIVHEKRIAHQSCLSDAPVDIPPELEQELQVLEQELQVLEQEEELETLAAFPHVVNGKVNAAQEALSAFPRLPERDKIPLIGIMEECRAQIEFLLPRPETLDELFPVREERTRAEKAAMLLREFSDQLEQAMQQGNLSFRRGAARDAITAEQTGGMQARLKAPELEHAMEFLEKHCKDHEHPVTRLLDVLHNGIYPISNYLQVIQGKIQLCMPTTDAGERLGNSMLAAVAAIEKPLAAVQAERQTLFPSEEKQADKALREIEKFCDWLSRTEQQLVSARVAVRQAGPEL